MRCLLRRISDRAWNSWGEPMAAGAIIIGVFYLLSLVVRFVGKVVDAVWAYAFSHSSGSSVVCGSMILLFLVAIVIYIVFAGIRGIVRSFADCKRPEDRGC